MINSIKNWFWRSETIAWARLQVLFGVVWGVISIADLSPLLTGKWLTIWLIFNGIVTELLRRRNTTQQSVVVAETQSSGAVEPVKKEFLTSPPPGP
jgi:hypothetical protein